MTSSKNWLSKAAVDTLPAFARVPPAVLLDPALGAPERLVFLLLCAHADVAGKAEPSLDRLAELAGFITAGKPDRAYTSKIVKKLVQRGWVVKLGQKGFNRVQQYELQVSQVALPELRCAQDRQLPNEEYKQARKQAQKKEEETNFKQMGFADADAYLEAENKRLAEEAAKQEVPAAQTDDPETEEELQSMLLDYEDGLVQLWQLPQQGVFSRFGLKRPTHRAGY